MARRSMWTGSISFGLVSIPVKLYPAVKEERIHFHMLHDQDHVRLHRKMVCPADGKEVHPEHIVKGYEVAPEEYVIVKQQELEAIAPERSKSIEISDFVDIADIDPIYYDRPYYLSPASKGAKPYQLLVEAMKKTKKVGIAKFVMRDKEYLAAIRPVGDVLCLETMHFDKDVVTTEAIEEEAGDAKVNDRELKVAQQLIDSLAGDFDPARYKDDYQKRVADLIEKKARGERIPAAAPQARKKARGVDLMAALEASLAQSKKKPAEPRRRKSA